MTRIKLSANGESEVYRYIFSYHIKIDNTIKQGEI